MIASAWALFPASSSVRRARPRSASSFSERNRSFSRGRELLHAADGVFVDQPAFDGMSEDTATRPTVRVAVPLPPLDDRAPALARFSCRSLSCLQRHLERNPTDIGARKNKGHSFADPRRGLMCRSIRPRSVWPECSPSLYAQPRQDRGRRARLPEGCAHHPVLPLTGSSLLATAPRMRLASVRALSTVHGEPCVPIVKRRSMPRRPPPTRYWHT